MSVDTTEGITIEELQLAVRNHSMPLEGLQYDVTPLGMHYLLTHFDIPRVDAARYELNVGGRVKKPMRLTIDAITSRPATTFAVTLECAGNGRARLSPRPVSQPWLGEAVGNAEWTGTPLAPILEEVGLLPDAASVVFTGLDRGIQGDVEQWYERGLSLEDAMRPEVLLAYAINGVPLAPQHGFPLRVIVPGWYGMTHVKWLRSITVTDSPFEGFQQAVKYQYRAAQDASASPVTRILPRALMVPPGMPDYMTRKRFVEPARVALEGRAWSGRGAIVKVEFSADGGATWRPTQLEGESSAHGWRRWTHTWDAARAGEYELCVRATDSAGNTQPLEPRWNVEGVQNNAVQRIPVVVGASHEVQVPADAE